MRQDAAVIQYRPQKLYRRAGGRGHHHLLAKGIDQGIDGAPTGAVAGHDPRQPGRLQVRALGHIRVLPKVDFRHERKRYSLKSAFQMS